MRTSASSMLHLCAHSGPSRGTSGPPPVLARLPPRPERRSGIGQSQQSGFAVCACVKAPARRAPIQEATRQGGAVDLDEGDATRGLAADRARERPLARAVSPSIRMRRAAPRRRDGRDRMPGGTMSAPDQIVELSGNSRPACSGHEPARPDANAAPRGRRDSAVSSGQLNQWRIRICSTRREPVDGDPGDQEQPAVGMAVS